MPSTGSASKGRRPRAARALNLQSYERDDDPPVLTG